MNDDVKSKLIIISGGGTGGPSVVPLALAKVYKQLNPQAKFLFIGNDPKLEKDLFADLLTSLKADYQALPAGKWRRYFSWRNFLDIFKVLQAFFLAYRLFKKRRPDLIISAGSFASVPVVWAAKFQGIKVLIHQQDIRPGLANRLMMRAANLITVTFPKSLDDYPNRATLIGNPNLVSEVKEEDINRVRVKFNLEAKRPLLVVTGGGSGALALNQVLFEALAHLPTDWQTIHQTGRDKVDVLPTREAYQAIAQLSHEDMLALLAAADIVVSRAGLGALTELSALAKTALIIPMPNSHQEDNAAYFKEKQAAVVLSQLDLTGQKLAEEIQSLYQDENRRMRLAYNINRALSQEAAAQGALLMQKLLDQK